MTSCFTAQNMPRVRSRNRVGLLIIFWAVFILSVSNQGEAKIWHRIRDFFFPRRTCRTTECGKAAQTIIDNRNLSVKPCDDFYEFACGGWIAAHPVPENKTKTDQFEQAANRVHDRVRKILETEDEEDDFESIKKARQVYRACLNSDDNAEENLQVLLDRLAVWGGWPIATEDWDESTFDWKKLLVNLKQTNDVQPLISIEISPDRANTSTATVVIDQGYIRFCVDHLIKRKHQPIEKWIIKTATKVAKAANQNVSEHDVIKDAKDLVLMEVALCQSRKSLIERQDEFRLYNPKTLKELQNFTDSGLRFSQRSKVNWVVLMKDLFNDPAIEITEDFRVIVPEPDYIAKMLSVIDKTTPRTIANYMLWQKIAYLHGEISEEFRKIGYDYVEDMAGVSGLEPRWKVCAEFTNAEMGHAIGYEYVKLYFDEDEKKKVKWVWRAGHLRVPAARENVLLSGGNTVLIANSEFAANFKYTAQELVTRILESFIEDLNEIKWMDAKTRSLAVEKAENMVIAVGYPDWYNKTNLGKYYEDCIVGNSHLVNMENIKLAIDNGTRKLLTEPFDRTDFVRGAADVNAYYVHPANMIIIPAGIFQDPFYVKERPEAMNYGGIGAIIGHEISHAFDVQGRSADKFGNLAQWWDETTLNTYLVKKECVEQQYAQYPLPEIATNQYMATGLDGVNTVSENIADNGGLRHAFKAYKRYVDEHGSESRLPGLKDYSPEQLFFIGFATAWCETSTPQSLIDAISTDVHSPSKYRVLIPLSNSEEYTDAWKCRDSDTKVTQKCSLLW